MRSVPSFFVSLINWELINAGGFWAWEHCSPKALKCQGTAPADPVGLKIWGAGPLLVNSLLKDRTSARSWWDLKFWFCSLQGTFLLKSSPILGPQWPPLPVLLLISCHFKGTWEKNQ